MGLEHAFLSQMREQLATGDILQKHVYIPTVLGQSFEVDLHVMRGTIKGWLMELSILYSLAMWSTCWDLMSSSLRMIFAQLNLPVALRLTSRTLPKEPECRGSYLSRGPSGSRSPWSTPTASLIFRLSSTLLYSEHRTNRLTHHPPLKKHPGNWERNDGKGKGIHMVWLGVLGKGWKGTEVKYCLLTIALLTIILEISELCL